jgi:hypothetical protein
MPNHGGDSLEGVVGCRSLMFRSQVGFGGRGEGVKGGPELRHCIVIVGNACLQVRPHFLSRLVRALELALQCQDVHA